MTIKNVIIFGASGQIGVKACTKAVNQGLNVRAFSRDSSQYPKEIKEKVVIVEGDVTNREDVKSAIEGQDAVIVTLGTRNDLAFLFFEPEKVPSIFQGVTDDHKRMFNLLKDSGLNWIAVFPPHFTDATSSKYLVKHGGLPAGRSVSKEALGSFMIDCLSQNEHYQKVCGISQDELEHPKS
ncbi:Flavin reductase (NADPH) [Gryllus bimaculatus]|nr:Flavin reductase (NADPH) [Gryllus bimaculatus]